MNRRLDVRLGVVSYANTLPLVSGLGEIGCELIEAVPSRCLELLRSGEVDLGLVPVIGLAEDAGLLVVPEVAIASDGPVESVLLLTRGDAGALESVAVDRGSRSSTALLRVLLAERYGIRPRFFEESPDWRRMLAAHEGALLIGDAALAAAAQVAQGDEAVRVLDLGAAWRAMTGLPFVFAVWAGREERVTPAVVEALIAARDRGLAELEMLARDRGPAKLEMLARDRGLAKLEMLARDEHTPAIPPDRRVQLLGHLDYLRGSVRYTLGARELAGLRRFMELARAHGVIPRVPELNLAAVAAGGAAAP